MIHAFLWIISALFFLAVARRVLAFLWGAGELAAAAIQISLGKDMTPKAPHIPMVIPGTGRRGKILINKLIEVKPGKWEARTGESMVDWDITMLDSFTPTDPNHADIMTKIFSSSAIKRFQKISEKS